VPGAEQLDFRDVEAFDARTAYLLSIGPGQNSRIYKTTDGGDAWALQFRNPEPEAFFDAIAFWDEKNGVALSDPVRGQFQLMVTDNGGTSWTPLIGRNMPPALPNEGAFAASGTCLITRAEREIWFCTGGAEKARIFHSGDRGQNWAVSESPLRAGSESAGSFSIAFRNRDQGMIVGGDYRKPNDAGFNVATTSDGGRTWTLVEPVLPFRSSVAWAGDRWVSVGTTGSSFSRDDGATWEALDQENYNSVAFGSMGAGWAVGPVGRIAKYSR
jgi:photosystem II stability/assembly factor-like uncharacterized protein